MPYQSISLLTIKSPFVYGTREKLKVKSFEVKTMALISEPVFNKLKLNISHKQWNNVN